MNDFTEEITQLVGSDQVQEALTLFFESAQRTEVVNQVIILKSNLMVLDKKVRAGVLSFDEEMRARNKVKFELLNLLESLDDPVGSPGEAQDDSFSFEDPGLDTQIEKLTKDQFKVLNFINKMKKVRVSGCAGSGKTLVAAEKAIRLAKTGHKVIFLCHNPNLSNKVKRLVAGTNVLVISFGQFIRNLNEFESLLPMEWNKYHEPVSEELEKALQVIEEKQMRFDAVIVDEAQDFREDWWLVVEALLPEGKDQILYLFHDDNQALLPYRSVYPIEEPVVDLSRNCRNAGKIFEFIKLNFHYQAPEASLEIQGFGKVKLFVFTQGEHSRNKVFMALDWMVNEQKVANPVVLLTGGLYKRAWEFGLVKHVIPTGAGWRNAILSKLSEAFPNMDVPAHFRGLSEEIIPTMKDVEVLSDFASNQFKQLDMPYVVAKLGPRVASLNQVSWSAVEGKVSLDYHHDDPVIRKYLLLKFLANPDWAQDLQVEKTFEFVEEITDKQGQVPVFEASSFKGLEADGVVLVGKGTTFSYFNELYVGSSRAKKVLAIVIDKEHDRFQLP